MDTLHGTIGTISEGALVVYRLGVNDKHDWTVNQFGFDATTVSILGTEDNYSVIAGSVNTCRVATVPAGSAARVLFADLRRTCRASSRTRHVRNRRNRE
jgi:hypothetical protein